MNLAIEEARSGMLANEGGPFGAVIVRSGEVIARAHNRVLVTNDPTAHAEIMAIRQACTRISSFQLEHCTIYSTCEPCPMCLGAIYWARPEQVFFGATRQDASDIGFDDAFIYEEINQPPDRRKIPMVRLLKNDVHRLFEEWMQKMDRSTY